MMFMRTVLILSCTPTFPVKTFLGEVAQ